MLIVNVMKYRCSYTSRTIHPLKSPVDSQAKMAPNDDVRLRRALESCLKTCVLPRYDTLIHI